MQHDLCNDIFVKNKSPGTDLGILVSAVFHVWQLCGFAEYFYPTGTVGGYPLRVSDCRTADDH